MDRLFPGEELLVAHGIPALAYGRPGRPERPLVLFLTGGGVLARIAYGHPEAEPSDFLDYWLAETGWGLVAPSYPGDHPLFAEAVPELGLAEWATVVAGLAAELAGTSGRPIIACGWSMGGKLVFALTRALKRHGLALDCFVSLCATPPFPRLDAGPSPENILPDGLWDLDSGIRDGTTRDQRWAAELAAIAATEGHEIIAPQAFRALYRTNVPPGLWGPEIVPYFEGRAEPDLGGALQGAGAFSGEDYPLCGAIVPVDSRDFRHALADEAVWGAITVRSLLHNRIDDATVAALGAAGWLRLRAAVLDAPRRLTRHVLGGHFSFVGRSGARATAAHLVDLHGEVRRLTGTMESLGFSPAHPPA